MTKYLNTPEVRRTLGVVPSQPPFVGCSPRVGSLFAKSKDVMRNTHVHLEALLERDVRVLLYDGESIQSIGRTNLRLKAIAILEKVSMTCLREYTVGKV